MIWCTNLNLKSGGQYLVIKNINMSVAKDMNILIKWDGWTNRWINKEGLCQSRSGITANKSVKILSVFRKNAFYFDILIDIKIFHKELWTNMYLFICSWSVIPLVFNFHQGRDQVCFHFSTLVPNTIHDNYRLLNNVYQMNEWMNKTTWFFFPEYFFFPSRLYTQSRA